MSIEAVAETAALWLDHPQWWLYPAHLQFAGGCARFHQRNRHHLRMAMSLSPALEQTQFWEEELPRREQEMQAGRAVHLIGFLKASPVQEVAGLVSFWGIEHGDFDACTMSFLIDRQLEGRGLMYQAVSRVLPEVVARHRLHRVMATHLPENLRSAALLKRLGFVVEGYARDFVRVNGQWRDNVLLSWVVPTEAPAPEGGVPSG